MAHQTTILFDDQTHKAVEDLASYYGCSNSEAVRRAVIGHWDSVSETSTQECRSISPECRSISPQERRERVRTLKRLFELFEEHDAEDELRRLNNEGILGQRIPP